MRENVSVKDVHKDSTYRAGCAGKGDSPRKKNDDTINSSGSHWAKFKKTALSITSNNHFRSLLIIRY